MAFTNGAEKEMVRFRWGRSRSIDAHIRLVTSMNGLEKAKIIAATLVVVGIFLGLIDILICPALAAV